MSILSLFYRWAIEEGYASAEPFTYRSARAIFAGTGRDVRVNLAVRRTPKPHVTIKYLEPDFIELLRKGLRGLAPDGTADTGFSGREMTRNAAIGDLALATGLRLGEFTHLLRWEIPALPASATAIPIPFPVPEGITKGRKARTTWISYEALAGLLDYLQLDRAAATRGSGWRPPRRWGEPLMVTDPDARGGRINGVRAPPAGGSDGRFVSAGGARRRRAVHRVGDGVRAHGLPHPRPVRAAVPPRASAPAAAQLLDADTGIPDDRLLPAGRRSWYATPTSTPRWCST
ncbi:MAG TPA: hypothetical protein VKA77_02030 [Mycobacterium sp.]|nr:hypothetical protein [Mycobacterium sp.]